MRNKSLLVSFMGLLICFSCKKQIEEPVVIEQKVFENLTSCCKPDTCNAPVTLKNITGKLVSYYLDSSGKMTYLTIVPDEYTSISDNILPLFSYYGGRYDICNVPEKLVYSTKERKIKFDCKFYYIPFKKNIDGTVPQRGGYPAQLLRIELLD
jgi:hypothetical protein